MRKIFEWVAILVSIVLGVLSCVSIYFALRDKKDNAATENAAAAKPLLAASSKNPYEDPNDPNTTEEGTCFSTGTMTGYFMEIKLSQQSTGIVHPSYAGHWGDWSGWSKFTNKTSNATAILTFVDIKYNEHPVFVSVFTKVRYVFDLGQAHPRLWCQEDFTEENDNAIRVPASYYNFMKYEMQNNGASLRRFNLTFMKNEGKDVMPLKYTQEVNVRLYTKDIPADSDDPNSPNFILDNWAGIMASLKKGGCSTVGCSSVPSWIWWILGGLGALFVLMLVVRLLRFGFGKR